MPIIGWNISAVRVVLANMIKFYCGKHRPRTGEGWVLWYGIMFIIMCNAMMSLYFFGAIFSSGLKCNIVVCYAVFAKSRILIYAWAFMIYDSNIKHKNNHNKQHQFIFYFFFLLPFKHKKLLLMFCIIETETTESIPLLASLLEPDRQ